MKMLDDEDEREYVQEIAMEVLHKILPHLTPEEQRTIQAKLDECEGRGLKIIVEEE